MKSQIASAIFVMCVTLSSFEALAVPPPKFVPFVNSPMAPQAPAVPTKFTNFSNGTVPPPAVPKVDNNAKTSGNVSQNVPFDEKAFASFDKGGTAKITGIAPVGKEIYLVPETAYTIEMYREARGLTSGLPHDPRLDPHVHKATADKNGAFAFDKLAAGIYYVEIQIQANAAAKPASPNKYKATRMDVRNGEVKALRLSN